MKLIRRSTFNRMKLRLGRLYGRERAEELSDRLYMLIGRYDVLPRDEDAGLDEVATHQRWSEKDAVLITYGDMVQCDGELPLRTLKSFCDRRLRGAINSVHVLPFFPSSSDAGFSVIDYRQVSPDLGTWEDIERLGRDYALMADLVLNHCSRQSAWFRDYVSGIAPYDAYFQEGELDQDYSQVVRPRPWPLFSEVETARGYRQVWTTFSEDQVDLNWRSPDVLFEFLDLLLNFVARGVRLIRLDAVAFLWKEPGTKCIHLPETHEVVKLMRDVLSTVAPHVVLLTETNVPHKENISYFGQADEAHMVYQFALPPLLLHGLLRHDSSHFQRWLSELGAPPEETTFFNFTASHDGIGMRPLEGLVPDEEVAWLVGEVKDRDGLVSYRSMPDGGKRPYELNVTYRDALKVFGDEELSLHRFLCSQCLMMSLRGIPGVYFHSVVGTSNWTEGPQREGGENRDINRARWLWDELEAKLDDPDGDQAWILNVYTSMLRARSSCPAFHPDAPQLLLETDSSHLAVQRRSLDDHTVVLCLFNFSEVSLTVAPAFLSQGLRGAQACRNLLTGAVGDVSNEHTLAPYECAWLRAV